MVDEEISILFVSLLKGVTYVIDVKSHKGIVKTDGNSSYSGIWVKRAILLKRIFSIR